tara:strand:+ start:438 stop:1070 length:633 start_codon:yes stop_codon:yes gene_type:complete
MNYSKNNKNLLNPHSFHNKSSHQNNKTNICRGYLTDNEYLEHMIPHHQVAVDISLMHIKNSKSPFIQQMLRKLIWTQQAEISLMKEVLKNKTKKSSDNIKMDSYYQKTTIDYINPNSPGLSKTYCDPNFFNPKQHMKHIKHMKLDDKMYIEHMIPHHIVAIDMSKVLIQNTTNDFMIYLAYRIIRSQQEEIVILNDYLHSSYKHSSELLN